MSEIDVIVASLGRAHGLLGEIMVDLRTDSPEQRFHPGSVLWANRTQPLTVRSFRLKNPRGIIGFVEVQDRASAEGLSGAELSARVDSSQSPDEADAFYDHQLVGLDVCKPDGSRVGSVEQVEHLGFQDLLVVRTKHDVRRVPFVNDLVPIVDLASGHLVIEEIPGLLEDD